MCFGLKINIMKKRILGISILILLSNYGFAGCYEICMGNGNLYLLMTDANGIPISNDLVATDCVGGPYVYECLAFGGPPDEDATNTMLAFKPEKLQPCTTSEIKLFSDMLKGPITTIYLDLKRLPQSTIDFLQAH